MQTVGQTAGRRKRRCRKLLFVCNETVVSLLIKQKPDKQALTHRQRHNEKKTKFRQFSLQWKSFSFLYLAQCVCRLLAWRQVFAHCRWKSKEKSLPETKRKTALRWGTWQCWRFQFFFLVGCYFVRFSHISICVVSFWCRICTIFVWTLNENVFEVHALARA